MQMSNAVVCEVCSNTAFKYKCPSCTIKYCSVPCYKIHQEKMCQSNLQETNIVLDVDNKVNALTSQVLFPTDDTVLPQTLEKLSNSKQLRDLLKNRHLRDVIKEVDSHPDAKLIMQRAMKEPIFTEFADVCLHIAEPPKEESIDSDSDSES